MTINCFHCAKRAGNYQLLRILKDRGRQEPAWGLILKFKNPEEEQG
jgi:hypothetical protein